MPKLCELSVEILPPIGNLRALTRLELRANYGLHVSPHCVEKLTNLLRFTCEWLACVVFLRNYFTSGALDCGYNAACNAARFASLASTDKSSLRLQSFSKHKPRSRCVVCWCVRATAY